MEDGAEKASSLRWKLLRQALLRRRPPNSSGDSSEISIKRVSRKAKRGFNLIPCQLADDADAEKDSDYSPSSTTKQSKDATLCFTLPVDEAPKLFLTQRVNNVADLSDFEFCNKHEIDNTGLVCQWPSEEVLAYFCLSHADMFRSKRVIELGSGYGLAALVIAAVTEASEIVISDGNAQVVNYIERNIEINSGAFGDTKVKPMMLHWNQDEISNISYSFDLIVASDWALHEKDKRPKGGLTRNQFFLVAFICSFAYYVLPGYLFSRLTSLSWICWIFPASILANQLGSGLRGLGVGAFGFDWSSICSYLDSPLASPWFATANVAVGFALMLYVIVPAAYWLNLYKAKTFPIFSDGLFTSNGQNYNVSAITDSKFHLDLDAYERQGPLHLSTLFAIAYGLNFACLTATIVHVILFHGRQMRELTKSAFQEKKMDVHTRLMRNYEQVPQWWFMSILFVNIVATIFTCQYYNGQLQLPWWGILLACGLAIFFTLPVGVIKATTNQMPGLNVITEYIIGYIYPGYPVANMCFKVYGYISMKQGIAFLQDFKLGHYMKIPPRSMFMAQVVGTIISAFAHLGTAWWLMDTIPDICDRASLPADSPWTCPGDHVFYDASVIWGLVGPRRIFGDLGYYSSINWFFLVGAIAPVLVWLAHKAFPNKLWVGLVNMPVIFGAISNMPPATAVNYTSWVLVGFASGFVAYRYHRGWWSRHNYVLSGALDAGLAFMGVLLYLCLGMEHVGLKWWGNDSEGCPLASCPTQQGVVVKGCPLV